MAQVSFELKGYGILGWILRWCLDWILGWSFDWYWIGVWIGVWMGVWTGFGLVGFSFPLFCIKTSAVVPSLAPTMPVYWSNFEADLWRRSCTIAIVIFCSRSMDVLLLFSFLCIFRCMGCMIRSIYLVAEFGSLSEGSLSFHAVLGVQVRIDIYYI